MGEKVEATKWLLWGIFALILLSAIGFALRPISMRVEREVLVQSHQYKEGMSDRAMTLQAALAEIDSRLSSGVDQQTKKNLEAQRASINVQLSSTRR